MISHYSFGCSARCGLPLCPEVRTPHILERVAGGSRHDALGGTRWMGTDRSEIQATGAESQEQRSNATPLWNYET